MDEAENLDKSEMKELLTSIHLSTLNLENLIDNLLEGSSIETGRFRVNPSPADIGSVILTACNTINPLLKKYGQKLKIELPRKLPLVKIDEKRINQVLLNIIANASKYGPRDEEIIIKAVINKESIEIIIGDRGKGVPEPYREKIFSGYVLANNDGERSPRGTGLGLSVSQTIIKAHGGQIGVRDRTGGGSEFWFTIPITGET
jgi:K+-sensing histidine kinase KdpD